jgi:SAM-dependent methyltransferase
MTGTGPASAQRAAERAASVRLTAPLSGAPRADYALGNSQPERERLGRQAAELRADSDVLLDRVGITHGWHAIDVGCGPEGILDLLAGRVGPGGWVTGLDVNPASAAAARRFASDRGYRNVEVVEDDARSMSLPSGSYDLVHARTLLGIEARADIYPHGHSRRTVRADLLKSMHRRSSPQAIADDHELDEVDTAVLEHLDDPRTLVLPNLLFLAWGRKRQ